MCRAQTHRAISEFENKGKSLIIPIPHYEFKIVGLLYQFHVFVGGENKPKER
jgi:hypothetical protein